MKGCSEIRSLLSEYVDDALDGTARALVDEHLSACPACREELDSLKTLIKGLGSIEPIHAPADFLDQLHRRMERPSTVSRLRKRLFYPLRVKVPLQLAGAAVAALFIFSILPLQQSSLKLSSRPEQEKKDAAYQKDEVKGTPAESPAALVQKAAVPEPARERREVTLYLKRQVRPTAARAERDAAQAPASPAAQEAQRHKLAAGAPVQEDKKEEGSKKEPESVLSTARAVEAAEGKVLLVDYSPQTGLPESVYVELPAGKVPLLYEKLSGLGDLKASPQTGTETESDPVHILVRLIVSP